MAKQPKLDQLPKAIKNKLIEKNLAGESYSKITEWLNEQQLKKISRAAIYAYGKNIRAKYSILIDLGMPIKEIIKHKPQIDALGVEQAKQQLLAKLAEKNGPLFAYLDKTEGAQ